MVPRVRDVRRGRELAARLVRAYILGLQGEALGPQSVACMVKHFPGGGPQLDGEDPHFHYGREQVYPGGNFDYHLIPFEAALAAGVAQVMPYYGMPVGTEYEEVGFGFNRGVITGLLRERYGFDGVVCSDWGLLTDTMIAGAPFPARAWGVEHLSTHERALKVIEAGVDQFGGEACPEVVVDLVRSGQVDEARIDVSVRRLLRDKFRLGLFDDPYVDPHAAGEVVGQADFRERGRRAQTRSIVLLKNDGATLPLQRQARASTSRGSTRRAARRRGLRRPPRGRRRGLVRIRAPFELRDGNLLETLFHAGDLDFKGEELAQDRRPRAAGADDRRHLPRPRGGHPGDRRRCGCAARRLRRERCRRARHRLRSGGAERALPVRAPVLDGGGAPPALRRPVRLGRPALPLRPRAALPGLSEEAAMDRGEMLRLFERHREAEAARDIDAILETFVDDCFLETMPLGLRSEGRQAVRAAYEHQFFTAFPDLAPTDEGMAFGRTWSSSGERCAGRTRETGSASRQAVGRSRCPSPTSCHFATG